MQISQFYSLSFFYPSACTGKGVAGFYVYLSFYLIHYRLARPVIVLPEPLLASSYLFLPPPTWAMGWIFLEGDRYWELKPGLHTCKACVLPHELPGTPKKRQKKCLPRESNSQLLVYKTSALTHELWMRLTSLAVCFLLIYYYYCLYINLFYML